MLTIVFFSPTFFSLSFFPTFFIHLHCFSGLDAGRAWGKPQNWWNTGQDGSETRDLGRMWKMTLEFMVSQVVRRPFFSHCSWSLWLLSDFEKTKASKRQIWPIATLSADNLKVHLRLKALIPKFPKSRHLRLATFKMKTLAAVNVQTSVLHSFAFWTLGPQISLVGFSWRFLLEGNEGKSTPNLHNRWYPFMLFHTLRTAIMGKQHVASDGSQGTLWN